ncbi:MAG: tRNA lysidine(34) synthetase TilS [Parvibaculaceae bacterium]|nr:tRNA lysidine(34) synthetase TilS [Parvibaculaceae bacterium]
MTQAGAFPGAITPFEFARAIVRLDPGPRLAAAVSGGPDSLALLLLTAEWAKAAGRDVAVLTVDHQLRPEAAAEARYVGDIAARLGMPHQILVWTGDKSVSGISAAAREARYGLLLGWCRTHGYGDLLVAHHQDDQAETFLMRLARGSGVDGLAAMAPVHEREGVRILRPLLDFPRARLARTVEEAGIEPVDDPSNRDAHYERVRVRGLFGQLGIEASDLAATASRMARARAALERQTEEFLDRHSTLRAEGVAFLEVPALAGMPEEIGLRALSSLLRTISGARYPGRLDSLERLYDMVIRGDPGQGVTLGGCQIARRGADAIALWREPAAALAAAELTLRPGASGLWDGRFELVLRETGADAGEGPVVVSALGEEGLADMRALGVVIPENGLPRMALRSLPALRRGKLILAVPSLGYAAPGIEADARFIGLKDPAVRPDVP